MSCLTINESLSNDEAMKRELGDRNYPIWLLVNPKYPAVRYDIWRPVLDEIQDRVFRELHTRIDATNIYIRSAVGEGGIVPNTLNWWGKEVAREIDYYRGIVNEHKPKMLISFGAFPFEFARRVYEIKPEKGPKAWSTAILKEEFDKAMENFDIGQTNRIPLLRRVVVSDKPADNKDILTPTDREDYFQYVGAKLADKIIEHKDHLDIWIS